MMEDPRNIYRTCPKHSSRPQAKYASWNPNDFVGKWIKVEFSEKGTDKKEHLWVKINAVKEEGILLGTVDNDPLLDLEVECGDSVEVSISKIESCFDGENIL